MNYIAPFRYTFEALAVNEMYDHAFCETISRVCLLHDRTIWSPSLMSHDVGLLDYRRISNAGAVRFEY